MNKYLSKHWNILKRSLKFDKVLLKLIFLDAGLIMTLLLSYVLVYYLFISSYLSISGAMGILNEGASSDFSGMDLTVLMNTFIAKVIAATMVAIVLYVIIMSLYSFVSHNILTKNPFKWNTLMNFLYTYSLFTLVYLLLLVFLVSIAAGSIMDSMVFSASGELTVEPTGNLMLLASIIVILTALYLYAMMIFYLVIKDDKIGRIMKHGFKSMVKLHDTLIPLILSFIAFTLVSIIIVALLGAYPSILLLIFFMSVIIITVWLRRYMHQLVHT